METQRGRHQLVGSIRDVDLEKDGKDQLEGPQNKYAGSTDGTRTTIADERNPSKTKELDWSYTPRKLTIENSSRREDGRKKNKREAKDQDDRPDHDRRTHQAQLR